MATTSQSEPRVYGATGSFRPCDERYRWCRANLQRSTGLPSDPFKDSASRSYSVPDHFRSRELGVEADEVGRR
jgi:hypothetical protein